MLQTLTLKENRIANQGALSIAEALRVNSTLRYRPMNDLTTCRTLNLYMNSIGTRGANALYEAIEVNGTISIVDINCNIVADKKFILKIEELCKKNDKKSPKRGYNGIIGKKASPKSPDQRLVRTGINKTAI